MSSTSNIRPLTFQFGLIGDGITNSLTPPMHEIEGHNLGLSVVDHPIDTDKLKLGVDELPQILDWMESLGYDASNVTHPFKQAIIPLLDEISQRARDLQAVNCVKFEGGKRIGHNTDWCGFQHSIERQLPEAVHDRVTLMGAGGAGSAVCYALLLMGAEHVDVYEVVEDKRDEMVNRMKGIYGSDRVDAAPDLGESIKNSQGLVNATPVGMTVHGGGTPAPKELLRPELWVADCVYLPINTPLLTDARSIGCRTIDGGGMAVGQCAEAFEIFTGVKPDEDRMHEAFLELVPSVAVPS